MIYFHKGEDIFIDSGKYTYDSKNPKKAYIVSPSAHTTIHKVYDSYELENSVIDSERLKINFVHENNKYIHIGAVNNLYKKLIIYRDIMYLKM